MFRKKEEVNYFEEFTKLAKLVQEAVQGLKSYILDFDKSKSEEEMLKIHEIENNADEKLHSLKNYLLKDFLPPIDREDIISISHRLDDVVDDIDEVAIGINILDLSEIREDIRELLELLEKITNTVYELTNEFKNIKKFDLIKSKIVEVNDLEGDADKLYESAIRKLYKEETDAIKIIKWTKIYETIENCFDSCENVADGIEEVVMKNV